MKKQLNTLPSTKPDHIYSSQPSQTSFHKSKAPNYQQQLNNLLITLRNVHRLRYYLLFRDFQSIFQEHEAVIKDILQISSADELWQTFVAKGQDECREQQQINFLLQILLVLNERKHSQADNGNIAVFDKYRAIIQWFIHQIVAYEAEIRSKIQEKIISSCQDEKKKRERQFKRYQIKVRRDFEHIDSVRKETLAERLQRETEMKNHQVLDKIERDMHKIRASSQLKDAKDAALLRKLAPYRWQKKRPYEDEVNKKQIGDIVEIDQLRRIKAIDNIKRVEKQKLKKAQQTLQATQQMHAQTMRQRMMIQINNEKSAFQNHEEKELNSLRHSIDMINNQRVNSLKKSLQAFNRHEDTLKIKQIMNDHHLKVQFNNVIQEATLPQGRIKGFDQRYSTIHTDRTGLQIQKTIDRHQHRLKKRITAILGDQNTGNFEKSSGRKSLVDLYDKSLNILQ